VWIEWQTQGQATYVSENIAGSGKNITTDNFFTNYKLARELHERKLSIVGTVRGNRREIPKEMLPSGDRVVCSSIFGFSDDTTLVSYVPKVRIAVILMSTQHHSNKVSTEDHRKPEIIQYYNETKSGVDILDKLVRTYSCKRATARWTVAFF